MNDGISPIPGWKLVPVEPTREMVEAACSTADNGKFSGEYLRDILRAVFAAAPTPLQAEMQKPDSLHLTAPGTEAKSLQPLLDAPLVEDVTCAIYDQWRNIDGWVAWEERGNSLKQDEARRIARIALGNRTPARQEAQPNEKDGAS